MLTDFLNRIFMRVKQTDEAANIYFLTYGYFYTFFYNNNNNNDNSNNNNNMMWKTLKE